MRLVRRNPQSGSSRESIRFIPSRVEGLPDVAEVVIGPDRLDLYSAGRWISFRFVNIATWPHPRAFWRWLARQGWWPHWLPVGERDWFHPPSERFFRFYTKPPLTIYLNDEPREASWEKTRFGQIVETIREGGFNTWDLG
jgi:hypothetical protein